MISAVFDVVPNTESGFEQFITERFTVGNGILISAEFKPPEVLQSGNRVIPMGHFMFFINMRPRRRHKFAGRIILSCLNKTTHAHRLSVGVVMGEGFAEFIFILSADTELCT